MTAAAEAAAAEATDGGLACNDALAAVLLVRVVAAPNGLTRVKGYALRAVAGERAREALRVAWDQVAAAVRARAGACGMWMEAGERGGALAAPSWRLLLAAPGAPGGGGEDAGEEEEEGEGEEEDEGEEEEGLEAEEADELGGALQPPAAPGAVTAPAASLAASSLWQQRWRWQLPGSGMAQACDRRQTDMRA